LLFLLLLVFVIVMLATAASSSSATTTEIASFGHHVVSIDLGRSYYPAMHVMR
jgi:hypothetical protein